jgi:hypothetical protein
MGRQSSSVGMVFRICASSGGDLPMSYETLAPKRRTQTAGALLARFGLSGRARSFAGSKGAEVSSPGEGSRCFAILTDGRSIRRLPVQSPVRFLQRQRVYGNANARRVALGCGLVSLVRSWRESASGRPFSASPPAAGARFPRLVFAQAVSRFGCLTSPGRRKGPTRIVPRLRDDVPPARCPFAVAPSRRWCRLPGVGPPPRRTDGCDREQGFASQP